ncbi:hypothetical protein L1987_01666 [Smallanthus sonchifolius]|uniref:Uncharacterized protein n=1 Tax=Smallanthus sonchifolius TaxID=185202 RepID=A0ACB9K5S2_9ASTR|nr:hypothetical protein L1987_01666 [Smallanthus sonchifolius]
MSMPIKDIIGEEWKKYKQEKEENNLCPELVVWVPKTGFTEFVKVNKQKVEGGFSIAIFCYTLHMLPFSIQPIFKTFTNEKGESNGTYDELLQKIEGKSSEVYMIVRATHEWNQTLWTFLKPFTWRLWIVIAATCIYIGLAVAILEFRVDNPKFKDSPIYQKIVMVIWFPISTFFFHEGEILNRNSKVVLVMWLSMIFIIVQIFTATLSSWLTLDQMRPRVPATFETAGYQAGTYLNAFIKNKYNCSGKDLWPLKNIEEYKNALSNGSVNAVFDELPYVELFLAKYGSGYMKFGPINQESGLAFSPTVVPKSHLSSKLSSQSHKSMAFKSTLTKPLLHLHPS